MSNNATTISDDEEDNFNFTRIPRKDAFNRLPQAEQQKIDGLLFILIFFVNFFLK